MAKILKILLFFCLLTLFVGMISANENKTINDEIIDDNNIEIYNDLNFNDNEFNKYISNQNNNVSIITKDVEMYYKNNTRFEVLLKDINGTPMINEKITIILNNQEYTSITNQSGQTSIALNLYPGIYNVTTYYNNDENIYTDNIITVLSVLKGNNITKYYCNDTQYYVTLLDDQGNPLKDAVGTININGIFYTRLTDENGIIRLKINLNPGKYELTVNHSSTGLKLTNIVNVLSTINGTNITKYYRNGTQYGSKIYDKQGNLLRNIEVTMNINGVIYKRTTNNQGIMILNINLNPGTYTITITHPTNQLQYSNTIKVLPTINGKDMLKSKGEKNPYEITVLNQQGKPLANKQVTINLNGVIYTRSSNSNGICKLNINLDPGIYIATTTCDGYSTSNNIRVIEPSSTSSYFDKVDIIPIGNLNNSKNINNIAISNTQAQEIANNHIKEEGVYTGTPRLSNNVWFIPIYNSEGTQVDTFTVNIHTGKVGK